MEDLKGSKFTSYCRRTGGYEGKREVKVFHHRHFCSELFEPIVSQGGVGEVDDVDIEGVEGAYEFQVAGYVKGYPEARF